MDVEIGAVTDEFSPEDLEKALGAMSDLGMTFAELRVVFGTNIIELDDHEIDRVRAMVEARGMRVLSIASPVLKCTLPNAPAVLPGLQQDVFGSAYSDADQPRLASRAFDIAERTGASIVRVFSYWRTVEPDRCYDAARAALHDLAEEAGRRGMVIGVENEHACNAGTGAEAKPWN